MPEPRERDLLAAANRAEAIRDNPETNPDNVAAAERLADEYRQRAAVAREREMRHETVIVPSRMEGDVRQRADERVSERAGFGSMGGGRDVLDIGREEQEKPKHPLALLLGRYF